MNTHYFILLLPGMFCQFDVKPDVRFDDKNERFDVSPLFDPREYEEREDFRRSGISDYSHVIKALNMFLSPKSKSPKKTTSSSKNEAVLHLIGGILRQISRRAENRQDDFSWHDDMKSAEQQQDYERNLEQFRARDNRRSLVDYLHGGQPGLPPSRRSAVDPDKEILLHHAVPIAMKVKGYLQAPLVS